MNYTIKNTNSIHLLITLTILVFLCSCTTAFTQDSTYKTLKPVFVQASLLYDFPQSYGVTAGIDFPLKSVIKNRVAKNGSESTIQKARFWGVLAGFYRYPYNYTGVLLMPTIGVRRPVFKSFFYESSLGIGVLRTFYDGKAYEVDAAGNVKEKSLFGRFYATTNLSFAFNFLLRNSAQNVLALQIKPSLWFQYPFDSFIKPHVSLEAGMKYEINTRSIRVSAIEKHRK